MPVGYPDIVLDVKTVRKPYIYHFRMPDGTIAQLESANPTLCSQSMNQFKNMAYMKWKLMRKTNAYKTLNNIKTVVGSITE